MLSCKAFVLTRHQLILGGCFKSAQAKLLSASEDSSRSQGCNTWVQHMGARFQEHANKHLPCLVPFLLIGFFSLDGDLLDLLFFLLLLDLLGAAKSNYSSVHNLKCALALPVL